jgi:hypothetical protein
MASDAHVSGGGEQVWKTNGPPFTPKKFTVTSEHRPLSQSAPSTQAEKQ